ncbi:hypothetical protein [Robertkochia aurantiaca]|uniref:hypothetical protein n=1 Tax=Robertkochia aurantiaca TaxID=2873700 RepID=UPI001CCFC5F8|nr:hypothetical protein [Robertkochia sp. 3YJGBD-33]
MKVFSFLCIVLGAILVFLFDDQESYHMYLKILGFILLMYGLFQSTRMWVKDNPRDDADDVSEN